MEIMLPKMSLYKCTVLFVVDSAHNSLIIGKLECYYFTKIGYILVDPDSISSQAWELHKFTVQIWDSDQKSNFFFFCRKGKPAGSYDFS